MRRRRVALGSIGLGTIVALLLVAIAAAGTSTGYADPVGDSPSTPDIGNVTVESDDATITFRVAIANREVLEPTDEVAIIIDVDHDAATGDGGWDNVIQIRRDSAALYRWTGSKDELVRGAALAYGYEPAVGFAVTVRRDDLQRTGGFNFYVRAWGADENVFDDAPDGDTGWSYSLRLPFALTLVPVTRPFTDKAPRSGKPFTLALSARREDTGRYLAEGTIRCAATVGGKQLARALPGFFNLGDNVTIRTHAFCAWDIPRDARGKKLRATISVTFQGATVRRTYTATVR